MKKYAVFIALLLVTSFLTGCSSAATGEKQVFSQTFAHKGDDWNKVTFSANKVDSGRVVLSGLKYTPEYKYTKPDGEVFLRVVPNPDILSAPLKNDQNILKFMTEYTDIGFYRMATKVLVRMDERSLKVGYLLPGPEEKEWPRFIWGDKGPIWVTEIPISNGKYDGKVTFTKTKNGISVQVGDQPAKEIPGIKQLTGLAAVSNIEGKLEFYTGQSGAQAQSQQSVADKPAAKTEKTPSAVTPPATATPVVSTPAPEKKSSGRVIITKVEQWNGTPNVIEAGNVYTQEKISMVYHLTTIKNETDRDMSGTIIDRYIRPDGSLRSENKHENRQLPPGGETKIGLGHPGPFEKGTHRIEIWVAGSKIGEHKFTVK